MKTYCIINFKLTLINFISQLLIPSESTFIMKKTYLFILLFTSIIKVSYAQQLVDGGANSSFSQPQPFLFTISTLNPQGRNWSLNYSGGYGERTVTPLG